MCSEFCGTRSIVLFVEMGPENLKSRPESYFTQLARTVTTKSSNKNRWNVIKYDARGSHYDKVTVSEAATQLTSTVCGDEAGFPTQLVGVSGFLFFFADVAAVEVRRPRPSSRLNINTVTRPLESGRGGGHAYKLRETTYATSQNFLQAELCQRMD